MRKALLGVVLALWLAPAGHAAPTSRILYAGNWTGQTEIFAIDPSGERPVAQITHWDGRCSSFPGMDVALTPSPDGRYLLARCDTSLWFMRGDGRDARQVVSQGLVGRPLWLHDSKQFAYELGDGVHLVDAASGNDQIVPPAQLQRFGWTESGLPSPDRRWIAEPTPPRCLSCPRNEISLVPAKGGKPLAHFSAFAAAWSPNGKWLALEDPTGIRVYDLRTRRLHTLTTDIGWRIAPGPFFDSGRGLGLAWSPNSRSIAYVRGDELYVGAWSTVNLDLRTVTLAGRTRSLVSSDHAYGGRMTAVAWAKVPSGAHYGVPDPAPPDRVSPGSVLADGRISLLAADGSRVAYEACDQIDVWTPATSSIEPGFPPGTLQCNYPDLTGRYFYYDLALAGDRVAYALNVGCNSITLSLYVELLVPPAANNEIAHSFGNCGGTFPAALGRFAGSGDLLVYGEWSEAYRYPPPPLVTQAAIRRVDGATCPCPELLSGAGPLYPADVNEDRLVAYGDNETVVLDRDGNRLLSLSVSPLAAQLSGNDLVIVTPGQLRDYDIRSAALLHTWRLPDVPSGPVCAWRTCISNQLVLEDAANGLVAYSLDGQLHVRRLADGFDSIVARASLARFMDLGLVYADGARIHLVPFGQLPLRGFG